MKNLLISTRLKLLIVVLALATFIIGYNGLRGIRDSNDALKTVYMDRTTALVKLDRLEQALLRNRLALTQALAFPSAEASQQAITQVRNNSAEATGAWDAYLATTLADEDAAQAKALAPVLAQYFSAQAQLLDALRAGDMPSALQLNQDRVAALFGRLDQGIAVLHAQQLAQAQQAFEQGQARFTRARIFSWLIYLTSLVIAIGMGHGFIRVITTSLQQAIAATRAVARGELTHQFSIKGKDEIAQLLQALQTMQYELTQVVSSVRQGSDAVASASSEIAHGNNDLSARTEQQASALQQTAASMEQLQATVQQNAQASELANQLSITASGVAQSGGQVVGQVVDTMKEINVASQKIAEIIAVIDGIAFQTNILALNAAVEAARAGEQGRGFAVVATEVRALAGRSASAAKEIRGLIQASTDRVAHGSALVDRAGQTMVQVVQSIDRVTHLMAEISAASHAQSDGVVQVGQAIAQMDQATQQNAALVEEIAAAAVGLKTQAQDLVQAVAVFVVHTPPLHQGAIALADSYRLA